MTMIGCCNRSVVDRCPVSSLCRSLIRQTLWHLRLWRVRSC